MKYEISIEDKVVLVIVSGTPSPKEYGWVARDIANLPEWTPGMRVLIDYSYLDLHDEAGTNADLYVQAVIPYKTLLGNTRCACVNTNPIEYGLGRMWQFLMETYTNTQIRIFYTYEEAMRWLSDQDPKP